MLELFAEVFEEGFRVDFLAGEGGRDGFVQENETEIADGYVECGENQGENAVNKDAGAEEADE